jgi:hypothetical protein
MGWGIVGGAAVDPFGYHTKLIELAYDMAGSDAKDQADLCP